MKIVFIPILLSMALNACGNQTASNDKQSGESSNSLELAATPGVLEVPLPKRPSAAAGVGDHTPPVIPSPGDSHLGSPRVIRMPPFETQRRAFAAPQLFGGPSGNGTGALASLATEHQKTPRRNGEPVISAFIRFFRGVLPRG